VTATLSVPNVPPQTELRAALWEEAEKQGSSSLHERLADVDPDSAAKILPGDAKRIIRALEVYAVTGSLLSSFHTPEGVQGIPRPNTALFGLTMDRARLYLRIEARVDVMLAAGFLDEVRELAARGYGSNLKAMGSLGYRHLLAHLAGEMSLELAIEELKRDTRRFAKRQLSWFGSDPNVTWLDVERNAIITKVREASPPEREPMFTAPTAEAVAETIADALASR
jgi:tRNA dimethylallyltransferase